MRRQTATLDAPFDVLLSRVRGEYDEMPGMQLTLPQFCRLFGVNTATCERLTTTLIAAGYLRRSNRGCYMRTR